MAGAGAAFRELLDLLRDADQTFLTGPRADMDGTGVAEGYRHLTATTSTKRRRCRSSPLLASCV